MRLVVLVLSLLVAAAAHAQSWPSRTVRLVVPLPPGSGSDLLARAFSQRLHDLWRQPVVVDNRPGGNFIIGTDAVAKADPDGHTLLFAIDTSFTVNPHLYRKLPYDPFKDFAPVVHLTQFPVILVANPSLPAADVAELIALAKKQPGHIAYSSIGAGSQMHLLSAMLANKAGIDLLHVPYKGIAAMTTAVLAGEVQLTWVGVFTARPHVRGGRLKALGASGALRSEYMPEVPTLAELGYPDVQMPVWYGLLAPAGTPSAIVERIHGDVTRIMAEPEFREKEMISKGYEPTGYGPKEFAELMKRESEARAEMVRISGARLE
jgi:tripartite-type tricarboxylate transporter receptor subunit TctC